MGTDVPKHPLSGKERFKIIAIGLATMLVFGFVLALMLRFFDFTQALDDLSRHWHAREIRPLLIRCLTLLVIAAGIPLFILFGFVLVILGMLGIRNRLTHNVLSEGQRRLSPPSDLRGRPVSRPGSSESEQIFEERQGMMTAQARAELESTSQEEPRSQSRPSTTARQVHLVMEEARYHSTVDPVRNPHKARLGCIQALIGGLLLAGSILLFTQKLLPLQASVVLLVLGVGGSLALAITGGLRVIWYFDRQPIPSWLGFLLILLPLLAFFLYAALQ